MLNDCFVSVVTKYTSSVRATSHIGKCYYSNISTDFQTDMCGGKSVCINIYIRFRNNALH